MVIKRPKKNFILITLVIFLILLLFSPLFFDKKFINKFSHNLITKTMTFDVGVSSFSDLVGVEWSNIKNIYKTIVPSVYNVLLKNIQGFPSRPLIKTIEININFQNYKKILDDRKRAFSKNILSNPTEVKAKIIFDGKKYNSKIRLKGDMIDHWGGIYRMSFRVKLEDDKTIFGFKRFSIHKPRARQHPYDQLFGALIQKNGGLSPPQTYARIIVNGAKWGVMNIEEHMSKEFLEKQKKKESIILKFGNEKDWIYSRGLEKKDMYSNYRIGSNRLEIMVYNNKKYFKSPYYRKLFSYVAQERVKFNDVYLYDIDKFAKAILLSTIFGNGHAIITRNCRYYFNPYTLKLEPITTDQFKINSILNLEKFNLDDPNNIITNDKNFWNNMDKYLSEIKNSIFESQNIMDYYQSFFPADKKIDTIILKNNFSEFVKNKTKYFYKHQNKYNYNNIDKTNIKPTKKQAQYFQEHIYARHFTNGVIDIYNLLPDIVKIISITHNNRVYTQNLKVDGFKNNYYEPTKIKTNILGIADKKIKIITEYKGNLREHILEYSFMPGPYFNPITDISTINQKFLEKISNNQWLIKKGHWSISKPIVLKGKVIIEPGTSLLFSENSYLIINGQLIALGKSNEKIIMTSNSLWKGLYVIGDGKKKSHLENVLIKNTTALEDGLLKLTGAVNFYNSNITIKDTKIIKSYAEDALNIINSRFNLDKVEIENTFSDGFDSDFSAGEINNSNFHNIGGDGLDFSGSDIVVNNSTFIEIRDKAVSVGESSVADLSTLKINNVGVGIASKDGSKVNAKNLSIKNFKLYAAMTYVKKDFYGSPSFSGENIITKPTSKNSFLPQDDTKMIVNGELLKTYPIDIKLLYQSETMKK